MPSINALPKPLPFDLKFHDKIFNRIFSVMIIIRNNDNLFLNHILLTPPKPLAKLTSLIFCWYYQS